MSTWSTRSEASMNDVDTDQRRHTITNKEMPPAPDETSDAHSRASLHTV